MKPWKILVTGSNGLIGSEAVEYFDRQGHRVTGIDNNMRRVFFGPQGDTLSKLAHLKETTSHFRPLDLDLRDREKVSELFAQERFDLVVHCAGQPSHDKAGEIPLLDFEVNTASTLYLLEATRQHAPEAAFVFMSTNKVYGDAPNEKPLRELLTRYDYADPADYDGIDEKCRIDRTMHSLFGVSKAAADLYAQEYARYFGLNVGILRAGCLTGSRHSGVELHGFLSYLVKVAVSGGTYTIYGYQGKQVRDNLHSYDVVRAIEEFAKEPHPGEVYNLGGGRDNSVSVLEAMALVEQMTGHGISRTYSERARKGDHICYISNLAKFKSHYPNWSVTRDVEAILEEMISSERRQPVAGGWRKRA